MARFYDAFKRGDVGRVNVAGLSDNGNAGVAFGNAFADFGKALREQQAMSVRQNRINAGTEALNLETENKRADRTQGDMDDTVRGAFGKYGTLDELYANTDAEGASAKVVQEAEAYYQAKFNDEALKTAVGGEYDSYKAFADANPELVKHATGTTAAAIDKHFADTSAEVAALKGQERETKHAGELLKMQQKVLKAQKEAAAGKKGFEYTEATDAKIADQVETAMGLDKEYYTMSDKEKKAFQDTVAGAARISKTYHLEPSLAIHVYENPDMYDKSADGKQLILREQPKTPQVAEPGPSWGDFDTRKK